MKEKNNIVYIFLTFLPFIGILPKSIQMLVILFVFFIYLFKNKGKVLIDKAVVPFIICEVIHICSVLFYIIRVGSFERVAAAINTISIWFVSCFIFSYLKKEKLDINKINKIAFFNIVILIFLSVIMLLIKSKMNITILGRNLIGIDWLNGNKEYRLLGFFEYSNLIVMETFMWMPFVINYLTKMKFKILKIIIFFACFLPIILTNSRIGIILSVIYFFITFSSIICFSKEKKFFFILVSMVAFLGVLFLYYNEIYSKIMEIINSRGSSTSMRFLIYQSSIEKALKESPIIGIGVKEFINMYPLGSHSTFIGFFYKTGFIGLFFSILGFKNIYNKISAKRNLLYKISYICLLIVLCVEDLDGANWMIALFFILLSVFLEGNEEYE